MREAMIEALMAERTAALRVLDREIGGERAAQREQRRAAGPRPVLYRRRYRLRPRIMHRRRRYIL